MKNNCECNLIMVAALESISNSGGETVKAGYWKEVCKTQFSTVLRLAMILSRMFDI